MTLRYKELTNITETDLNQLIENQVPEGREIEYKAQLPGKSDKDKREFLYDVSSFANCIGGDLIFGITEKQGVPKELSGLAISDIDSEKLHLTNLIQDSVKPRIIPSVTIHDIPLSNSKIALIVRVRRSLAQPHAVTLGGTFYFYSRNSAGKYRLDVGELRRAFLQSQESEQRIKDLRLERIALITAGEAPISLPDTAKIVLHLVPFGAFELGLVYDVSKLRSDQNLRPIAPYSNNTRYNFHGLLSSNAQNDFPNYLQVFRNGIIEAVDTLHLRPRSNGNLLIPAIGYEERLIEAVGRYLTLQQSLGVDPPIALAVTLTGIRGYTMSSSHERFEEFLKAVTPIDQEILLIPAVIVQDFAAEPGRILRPVFDAVWNAAGWPESLNYDNQGNWRRYQ